MSEATETLYKAALAVFLLFNSSGKALDKEKVITATRTLLKAVGHEDLAACPGVQAAVEAVFRS